MDDRHFSYITKLAKKNKTPPTSDIFNHSTNTKCMHKKTQHLHEKDNFHHIKLLVSCTRKLRNLFNFARNKKLNLVTFLKNTILVSESKNLRRAFDSCKKHLKAEFGKYFKTAIWLVNWELGFGVIIYVEGF